jgi:hypothetical protein
MAGPDLSSHFSPFYPAFRYHPQSPFVQAGYTHTFLSPDLHPALVMQLHSELEIPQERDMFFLEQWRPLGWEGWFFDLVGTVALADDPQEAPRFWLHSPPPDLPQTHVALDSGMYLKDTPPILAWRRRAIYQHGPLWIEARWHPATGETLTLRGLEKDWRQKSVDRARQGIKLLKAIEAVGGGRPPDMEEAAFRQYYWNAYQKVLDQKVRAGSKLPNKTEVAAEMLIITKTLKRNRDKYNLPWPPLPPD